MTAEEDVMTEDQARQTRDVCARMHETNATKGTEYRMDPGLAESALSCVLAALDAERAAHEETRREREALEQIAEERRDRAKHAERERDEARRGADLYRADRDYHCDRAIRLERERDAERSTRETRETERDMWRHTAETALGVIETAARERDEARAALVGLREAAELFALAVHGGRPKYSEGRALAAALAATPSALAGKVRARVLREAAERLDHDAAEACAARREPEPYRLATTGEMFQPTPSCDGYYERGLRCPDCPSEASGAETLRALADEAER